MEAYYIIGSVLAACALIVSLLGVVRKDFPASAGAERTVALVFIVLFAATIGAAILGSAIEEDDEGGHEEAALVLQV